MYKSLKEILEKGQKEEKPFWKIILEDDQKERQVSGESSKSEMAKMYDAMKEADVSYDGTLRSASGLVGTDGKKLEEARKRKELLSGDFIGRVMEKAMKMGESNACMKRIVAAPTARSCGVLPAVLLSIAETEKIEEEQMIQALYVAAGIGGVIAYRASISGACGGCQAEVGSASAMAAGALTYLRGGNEEQIVHASAISLKNLLGLACDPVAGLVEVPCVKRNVVGAVNAVTASDMALCEIKSAIPPDEVIDAMDNVAHHMDSQIRETGEGGLAATETGKKIAEELRNQSFS